MLSDEPQTVTLSIKGPKEVIASDIKVGGQVEILNGDLHITEVTGKVNLNIEMRIEKGFGFISKEVFQKEKVDVGTIAVDAIFTPIRRVSYEVENMRVGDNTNHNRLRISIETDGTLSPREALSQSIVIMINQLKAIVDFKEPEEINPPAGGEKKALKESEKTQESEEDDKKGSDFADVLKTRTDSLDLSTRTLNALTGANIRTLGGLARKKREDLLEVEGIGEKGISEIKKVLSKFGLNLKE
jgi:DNA-directed RNA polymerase subunit alpha